MARFRMIMLSQALPGREADYESWYDDIHIPDMLQVPGCVAAQRFRVVKDVLGKTSYPYCTIYEFEADSADAAMGAMFGAMQAGKVRMSDTVDPTSGQGFFIEEVRERATAG
ncbi:MAG: hypothetical protein ABW194_04570 [Novosphingobium sp.]